MPTPESLANVALYYLARYAASEASLRRVLENRVRRAAMENPDFAADAEKRAALRLAIVALVEKHRQSGALNDAAFAAMKVGSLRRSGGSARRITQKLQQKGIAAETIAAALRPDDDGADPEDAEFIAASLFAKKRGLGRFCNPLSGRKKLEPADRLRRDFAAMLRAGFSYDIARKVLDGEVDIEAE